MKTVEKTLTLDFVSQQVYHLSAMLLGNHTLWIHLSAGADYQNNLALCINGHSTLLKGSSDFMSSSVEQSTKNDLAAVALARKLFQRFSPSIIDGKLGEAAADIKCVYVDLGLDNDSDFSAPQMEGSCAYLELQKLLMAIIENELLSPQEKAENSIEQSQLVSAVGH